MKNITDFFNEIAGKKVTFIGIGVSNTELIKMFAQRGIDTEARDKASLDQIPDAESLQNAGAKIICGKDYLKDIDADIVFRTPGMYWNHPALIELRKRGIVVTSETELFFELCPCKKYAVTGSDGKTTTTTLIAEMLAESNKTVYKGGNIGKALLPMVESIKKDDVAVAELSSFQLISMRQSPDVAVITNITPNHLDVHKNMGEYIFAKKNIFTHQNAFSRTVLNLDNAETSLLTEEVRGELRLFSRREKVENGAFLDDGFIAYNDHGKVTRLFPADAIRIPGKHNVENVLAAISALWGDVPPSAMEKVAREFSGVEHRIEPCREIGKVRWYNDSIATTPTRTIAGLRCFSGNVILIAGGYDKNLYYGPLGVMIVEKCKLLILMGATAEKIERAVRIYGEYKGIPEILHVDSMEEAVALANERAESGDTVMLSPASASFDKYKNFEKRGEHFKALVAEL